MGRIEINLAETRIGPFKTQETTPEVILEENTPRIIKTSLPTTLKINNIIQETYQEVTQEEETQTLKTGHIVEVKIKVRFDMKVDKDGEERKKAERKKVVHPLKLQKSKSSENSEAWEIANNQNKDDETGIAAKTRSKCAIDISEITLKSAL